MEEDVKASWDDLNEEQRARLCKFRSDHPRDWKAHLANLWWNGKDANLPDGHLLRQIRNQYGPVWLNSLKD